jgi:multidrug efflux pump subunit AcrA (membrane-fusion protein)
MSGGLTAQRRGHGGAFADPQAWRDIAGAEDPIVFSGAWLSLLVGSIDMALAAESGAEAVVLGGFVALRVGDGRRFTRTATYGGGEVSFLLAKAAERCLQVRRSVGQTGGGAGAVDAPPDAPSQIAVPIMVAGELEGVVALELSAAATHGLDRATRLAQWGTAWFSRIIARREDSADRGQTDLVVKALGLAASKGSLAAIGQALCSFLADRLGATRVSLGAAEHGPQRVIATSRGSLAEVKTDFLVALGAALDEAVSAGSTLLWPVPEAQLGAIGAHERLCRAHDVDWAASIPVAIERLQLVMCFEGTGEPPGAETMTAWQEMVRLLAPLLALQLQAQRSLPAHGAVALRHAVRDWTVDAPRWRWGVLALAAAAVVFLAVAQGDYRVAARATLEGALKRSLVAPFDGYLAEATARPGDRVHEGAVLARLEDRDLRLQRLEYQSRITEAQRQVTDSVGRRDMAGAAIATARRQQGEAELKLVEENLSRAAITAPFDALVISGDPTQSIGAPLHRGETIYELSPLDGFRVAVDVDEEDLAEMQPGQTGRVLLSSLPYTTWPMTVQRVTPIASARDGHTVFRVEGRLDPSQGPQDASLRPGMQGIVKIDVGPRRYVWIWTHNAIAWARLKIWELVP